MKFRKVVIAIALAQIGLGVSLSSTNAFAESKPNLIQEEIEKGPNDGRMLRDDDFAVELAIYETDTPPEFRVFVTKDGVPIPPSDVDVKVKLTRLGDGIDDINFYPENEYLRGDMVIYEPHSFLVTLTANYQGNTYSWSYANFEGRTKIDSTIADSMEISTDFVSSQMLDESLKVYGELTLPSNAERKISARYPGEITSVNFELGEEVKKGEVLFTIQSSESLQSYKIISPIDGVITYLNAGIGEQSGEKDLMKVTNTSELIAELKVYPKDLNKSLVNSKVTIAIPGTRHSTNSKIIDSLYKVSESQAKIFRAIIDNREGYFSPGQFISAEILIESHLVSKAVKEESLQTFRDFTVVYGKFGEQYEVRMLELGRKSNGWVEVISGIPLGTEYVTTNSYVIKADIEKSGASHDH